MSFSEDCHAAFRITRSYSDTLWSCEPVDQFNWKRLRARWHQVEITIALWLIAYRLSTISAQTHSRVCREEDRFTLPDQALRNARRPVHLYGPQCAKLLLELYLLQQRIGEQFAKSNILALQLLKCADLLPRR